jgi:hypothetical protein
LVILQQVLFLVDLKSRHLQIQCEGVLLECIVDKDLVHLDKLLVLLIEEEFIIDKEVLK